MKKKCLLFTAIILTNILFAQHISVESFRMLENDMDARVNYPKLDQNGEVAALIKVVTTETGFSWDGGMLGIVHSEHKTGEYWLYVPRGAQRITIFHDKLGVLRNYAYTVPIESATVYEMRLTTARIETTIIEPEAETQWLVVNSEPSEADVYIDNIHKGQTPLQIELNTGTYSYRIEKPLYHPKAGRVELSITEKSTINETLEPNYGYLKITTQPEPGAEVTINGTRQSDKTPLTTGKLVSGSYQITVSKPLYHAENREVVVHDGQTIDVDINLRPNFGVISINTSPEAGAEVLVNSINTGKKTPCELDRLATGQHQITVRKEWYQPKTISIDVTDGYSDNITIDMQPTFGTLNVQAEHQAEIFINDQHRANGNWEGRLIAGWYTVEARKDKYHSDQKRIEINLGGEHNLSLHPKPKTGMLKVQTTPYDADIVLNGISYGKTPATIRDLLVGDYEIVLSKEGYGNIYKQIKIIENKTTEIKETLPNEIMVTITSDPEGATLFLDEVKIGQTPYTGKISIGNHMLKIYNNGKFIQKPISVSSNSTQFSFDISQTLIFTESSDELNIEMIFVEGGTFKMGCSSNKKNDCVDNSKPVRQVKLNDFYISKFEITQGQWQKIMSTSLQEQKYKATRNNSKIVVGVGQDYPMYYISWNEVQEFIKKLNQKTGKKYRLPTEAEWEYAARGGQKSMGYKFAGSDNPREVAWYKKVISDITFFNLLTSLKVRKVGMKNANELDLYDMSGNVNEWCEDDWHANYLNAPGNGSAWINKKKRFDKRILRGGGWYSYRHACMVFTRNANDPDKRFSDCGFRLAMDY